MTTRLRASSLVPLQFFLSHFLPRRQVSNDPRSRKLKSAGGKGQETGSLLGRQRSLNIHPLNIKTMADEKRRDGTRQDEMLLLSCGERIWFSTLKKGDWSLHGELGNWNLARDCKSLEARRDESASATILSAIPAACFDGDNSRYCLCYHLTTFLLKSFIVRDRFLLIDFSGKG